MLAKLANFVSKLLLKYLTRMIIKPKVVSFYDQPFLQKREIKRVERIKNVLRESCCQNFILPEVKFQFGILRVE